MPSSAATKSRVTLRSRLEYDVDRVLKQLESSNANQRFKSTPDAYDAIQRSNSSLKRQKKKPLEDAIDRVLLFHRQEADDSSHSDAAIEEAEATFVQADDRFLLNRQMTKLWHDDTSTTGAAKAAEQSPAKKRRLQEESEDASAKEAQTNGKITNQVTVSAQEKQPLKKTQKPSRFEVEHVGEQEALGGLGTLPADLLKLTSRKLGVSRYYEEHGSARPTGVIISGPGGMGKRSLVNNIASMLEVPIMDLEMCFMEPERMAKSLKEAFDAAMAQARSIIFIGEVQFWMGRPASSNHNDFHGKAVRLFTRQMRRLKQSRAGGANCIAIATTSNMADVDPELLKVGLFEKTLEAKIPDYDARRDVLTKMTRKMELRNDVDLDEIARITYGFVPGELALTTNEAELLALDNLGDGDDTELRGTEMEAAILTKDVDVLLPKAPVSMDNFRTVLKNFVPSLRKEGFSVIPNVTWDQVGALTEAARKQLYMSIIVPIKHPSAYREFGLMQNAGVLLWGPPGCGKTLIAQAVANEAEASFILISGPELLNKYVGESERAVRELFQRARSSKPCIIFFDEMDSVVPSRATSSTDSGARVVNALLTELDGAQDRTGVYVIGTTNRLEMIDEAILRPGRLGSQIFLDLPTEAERVDILGTIYRTRHGAAASPEALSALEGVARDRRCANFSGADLSGLHTRAAQSALERWMTDEERGSKEITAADWEFALENTRASVRDASLYRVRNLVGR